MISISSRSCAASSGRLPSSKAVADSSRCFTILARICSTSSSLAASLPAPRLAMSRSWIADWIIRSVNSARLSCALSAVFRASAMVSRIDAFLGRRGQ